MELQVPGGWQSLNQSVVVVHEARIEARQPGEDNPQLLPDGTRSRLLNNAILQPGPSREFTVGHYAHNTTYRTHSQICRSGVRITANAIANQHADVSVEFVHCPLILAPLPTTTVPETTTTTTTVPTTIDD